MSKSISESSLVFLNTKDSISPLTPHDTTFVLNGAIITDIDDYAMSIQNVEIPNLRYVVSSINDKLYFKENGGGTITATLTSQNYNGTELALEVGVQLTANSTVAEIWTGTFNSQNDKITVIGASGLVSIQFVSGENDSSEITGFVPSLILLGGGIALNMVRLDGTSYLDVITNVSTDNYSSDLKSNVLVRVPVLVDSGNIIFYQNATDDFLNTNANSLQTMDFRLFDDKGRPFVLPSIANVSLVLKLTAIL